MAEDKKIVVFKLGDVKYGFPIEQVNEIIRYMEPSKVPNSPHFLEGIISLRGSIHAVIDLRNFFGMEKRPVDENTKIIIANENKAGFIVDEVSMIVTPKSEEIDVSSELPKYIDSNYVLNILKMDESVILVLNMCNIFSMDKRSVI